MAGLEADRLPKKGSLYPGFALGIIGGLVTIAPNFRVGLALPLPYQRRRSPRFTGRRVRDLAPSDLCGEVDLYLRQQRLNTSTTAGP
jgi:hypothetical protein